MATVYQLVDRNKRRNVFFLQSILTTGTYGALLAKHKLSINDLNGVPAFPNGTINFQELELPLGYVSNLAETAGVVKPTEPILALGGEYGFTLTQYNPYTGATVSQTIYASVPLVGGVTTPGTIATAWKSVISFLEGFNIASMTISGGVLTITAAAGYPLLTVTAATGGTTFTSGTPGVAGIGNNADMEAMNGITSAPFASYPGWVAGTSYDLCVFNWNDYDGNQCQTILFVNINDATYASWKTLVVTDYLDQAAGYAEAALAVN